MKDERNCCSVCGAALQMERITYVQTIGETIFLVDEVPAQVCAQCGERYLSPDTVDAIQDLFSGQQEPESIKVPLYHFPRAVA